jgi:hypothetical protein
MKKLFLALFVLGPIISFGQHAQKAEFNTDYNDLDIEKSADLVFTLDLEKDSLYRVSVFQNGVDVALTLDGKNEDKVVEKDSPNGEHGLEEFMFLAPKTDEYRLTIKSLEGNTGKVNVHIKKFSPAEILLLAQIKQELEPENNKNVQTLDIDHFWQAFDHLKNCKTHSDSVASFQKMYLDRATNGLLEFMKVRDFSAEKFVTAVSHLPGFFKSVRKNTYELKRAVPAIDSIFQNFKSLYPNFKPFKVCFAVGLVNTGGTVSDNFVLIGSEVSASTKDVEISEFRNITFAQVLTSGGNVSQKIKNIVSHECVHTQQKTPVNKDAVPCELLYKVMKEGFCDFIGELLVGSQINLVAHEYGDLHEKELWTTLKGEMCSGDISNWLYNYGTAKDKPADLGYYMGYRIAKAYYENAIDKKQAIADMIEMNDPITFLEKSQYGRQFVEK